MTVSKRARAICILAGVIASAGCVAASAEEPSLKPGLPWVQFHSPDFTRPAESGVDRQINLDTGRTIDGYSRIWMGLFKPPASGRVSLAAEAGYHAYTSGRIPKKLYATASSPTEGVIAAAKK